MEMISIPRDSYEEFLRWKGGAAGTPKPSSAPAGGWRYYREGVNPFAAQTLNTSAQSEIATFDIDCAVALAERANSPLLPTLREMREDKMRKQGRF